MESIEALPYRVSKIVPSIETAWILTKFKRHIPEAYYEHLP